MKTAHVVLFSGGRTSGFMLRHLLDKHPDFQSKFITCFCNTGKERNETLDFVHEVETRWGVPLVWLEYHRVPARDIPLDPFPTLRRNQNLAKAKANGETAHWFRITDYQHASRKGEPFDELLNWMSVLPNVTSRGCSMQLKIRTAMRYLFSLGVDQYWPQIGIRTDEAHRSVEILTNCDTFEHPQFPLIEAQLSLRHVADFWRNNNFDLQLESYEGNCDLCFLKAKWKRIRLIQENPGMVDWWKEWESKHSALLGNGKVFRLGQPYAQIEQEALAALNQHEFCLVYPSKDADIPCSCAEKAFGANEEE